VKKSGPPTEKEHREWLKAKHKLGTNAASWIAERTEGKNTGDDDPVAYLEAAEKYVAQMFSGSKAALRPIYDELLQDTKATGRLIDTGGYAKKDRITHRIPITSAADIDDEVQRWLKAAYGRDA